MKRRELWIITAFAALAACFNRAILSTTRIYNFGDIYSCFFPLKHFFAHELKLGRPGLWCPYISCGINIHGSGQLGMLHPVNLAAYGLLNAVAATNLTLIAAFFLAMTGTYLFARRSGLSPIASSTAAFVFGLGPVFVPHAHHLCLIQTAAHLPFALIAADALVRSKRRLPGCLGLAAVTGSLLLLGYPQYTLFIAIAVLIYLVAQLGARISARCEKFGSAFKKILFAFAAYLLGAALGAAQLLPTLEAKALSERSGPLSWEFTTEFSLHPTQLATYVFPYAFGFDRPRELGGYFARGGNFWEFSIYVGLAVWVLAFAAVMKRRKGSFAAPFWAGTFVLWLLFSLGRFTPLYRLVYRMPLLNALRCPCRGKLVFTFALGMLAALGIDRLTELEARDRNQLARASLGCALVLLASVALGGALFLPADGRAAAWISKKIFFGIIHPLAHYAQPSGYYAERITEIARSVSTTFGWRFALHGLVGITALVTSAAAFAGKIPRWAFAAVILAELTIVGVNYNFESIRVDDIPHGEAERLAAAGGGRVRPRHYYNTVALIGAESVFGYDPLAPQRNLKIQNHLRRSEYENARRGTPHYEDQLRAARAMDARWWWTSEGVVKLPGPLRRFYLASGWTKVTPQEAFDALLTGKRGFKPGQTALVEAAPNVPRLSGGKADWLIAERVPGFTEVDVYTDQPRLAVLAESFHAGWKARIDGQPVPIQRANYLFQAVEVPAGTHTVTFEFKPDSFSRGVRISLAALAVLAVLCWLCVFGPGAKASAQGRRPGETEGEEIQTGPHKRGRIAFGIAAGLLWLALLLNVAADVHFLVRTNPFRADPSRCDICGAPMRYALLANGPRCLRHAFRISFQTAIVLKVSLLGLLAVAATAAAVIKRRKPPRSRAGPLLLVSVLALIYATYAIFCAADGRPPLVF